MISISVIVPIYNVEKYLESCLLSIKNQKFDDFEVILVDDGSTDSSRQIAEQFVKMNPEKFKLICQKNQGLSGARNTGIIHSTGEYVCCVDSDDWIDCMYLSEMHKAAIKNNADLVFCAYVSVDEFGTPIKEIHEERFKSGKSYSIYETPELLLMQNAAWNKMYRRNIIVESELIFTPKVWYEDIRFTKKYLSFCKNCVYCDKVLYYYMNREGSIMNSMGSDRNLEIIDAIKEIEQFYIEKFKERKFFNEIEFMAIDHIYISTLVRFIRSNKKDYKNKINEIVYEFKKMFPNYKKNPYITTLDNNRKIIFYLLNLKLYRGIYWLFKIKEKN